MLAPCTNPSCVYEALYLQNIYNVLPKISFLNSSILFYFVTNLFVNAPRYCKFQDYIPLNKNEAKYENMNQSSINEYLKTFVLHASP